MKKIITNYFFILAGLLMVSTVARAQVSNGRYDVRLVHGSYNCAKDSVVVCVEIRATSADSAFVMGNANFLIIYQNNQLSSPVFRSRGIYSGGNYSLMSIAKTPGDPTSALSINVVNNGVNGEGQPVDTNWRTVACLAFSTAGNAGKCYNLTLSATNPTTLVTMAYPNPVDPENTLSLTKEVKRGTLTSITNQCPTTPIATLSGGGTIASGGSANLTLTSQNNVLPATVVVSGGAGTVTLTSVDPTKTLSVSPTQTTSYTIQSVTGECGTGSGQGSATVTLAPCTTPIVTLSGGGNITAGGSANLTITSQNNIFPATVTLSNGTSVTLTQQEPGKTVSVSPSQTTNYTIQSVTGTCGAGNGQGTAIVTLNSSPCPPEKCVPLTIRILK